MGLTKFWSTCRPAGDSTAEVEGDRKKLDEDELSSLLFLLVLVICQTPQTHVASLSLVLKVSDYLSVNFYLFGIYQVSFSGLWADPNV